MLRVSIYHWLPLADNMLPDIDKALRLDIKTATIGKSSVDFIEYSLELDTGLEKIGKVHLKGNINSRGFSQSIIDIPPPKEMALGPMLEMMLPTLQDKIASLLFDIVPYAIKNKTGILEEKIVSFQQFESRRFETYLDNVSKRFLRSYCTVAVMVDRDYQQDMRAGFYIDFKDVNLRDMSLEIAGTSASNSAACNESYGLFLFYSQDFTEQELQDFENVVYKYCATVTYLRFIERTVDILKDVRDHVIPLRRQLAIALQRNTEEYFVWLTQVKKYLTYVNIKLPIIERVKNHLQSTYEHGVKLKLKLFENASSITPFSTLKNIQAIAEKNKPLLLDELITEALRRLDKLHIEAKEENSILSNELSQVLAGSLQSEHVQITARDLDASRSLLELDRGGKNRADALKVLSVVTSGTLGLQIADVLIKYFELEVAKAGAGFFFNIMAFLYQWNVYFKLFTLFGAQGFALIFTEWFISRKSHLFRLVIPFSANLPPENLHTYIENKKSFIRFEASGQRRVVSWNQLFISDTINRRSVVLWRRDIPFTVTIDYEKRGYVYSVSLEVEHRRLRFDVLRLVIQLLSDMDKENCLRDYQQHETSLLAEVLLHLGLNLEENLIALNKILALSPDELSRDIDAYIRDPKDPSISEEDRRMIKDIYDRRDDYVKWLIEAEKGENKDIPLSLLGTKNVKQKLELLMKVELGL